MSKSKIEWTDAVWNPVSGCTKLSEGCRNCYAERMSKRLAGRCGYPKDEPFKVTLHPDKLADPLKWKKPRRIFVNSMSDLFHQDVPFEFIDKVFATMFDAGQHTFMILTKRPDRMMKYLSPDNPRYTASKVFKLTKDNAGSFDCDLPLPLPNVWLGVSVENQVTADERIPLLLQTPAEGRFISAEPLLGPVDLSPWLGISRFEEGAQWVRDTGADFDWVIVGGESGPKARPMHPDWVKSLRDQCQAAETKFFFKQWGEWFVPEDGSEACRVCGCTWNNACDGGCYWAEPGLCSNCVGKPIPDYRAVKYLRVGKKQAGHELDGQTWNELPEMQQCTNCIDECEFTNQEVPMPEPPLVAMRSKELNSSWISLQGSFGLKK